MSFRCRGMSCEFCDHTWVWDVLVECIGLGDQWPQPTNVWPCVRRLTHAEEKGQLSLMCSTFGELRYAIGRPRHCVTAHRSVSTQRSRMEPNSTRMLNAERKRRNKAPRRNKATWALFMQRQLAPAIISGTSGVPQVVLIFSSSHSFKNND